MPAHLQCSFTSSIQLPGPQSPLPCCPAQGSAYVVQTWTLLLGEGRGPSQVMKPRGAAPVPAAGTPLFLRHSCLCQAPTHCPSPAVQS